MIPDGIDVSGNSEFKTEKEILFQPFSFYRITKVDLKVKEFNVDICLETVVKTEILEEKIKLGKEIKYNENENIMGISWVIINIKFINKKIEYSIFNN